MTKIKNNNSKRILFLGSNGFPFGSAVSQRQLHLAKSITDGGFKVTIINRRSPHSYQISKREKILVHGFYEGIEYFYSSLLPYRATNFFKRNSTKLLGTFLELFIILYYRFLKKTKYIFANSIELKNLKYYYVISKIFKMKLIYDYVEIISSLRNRDKKSLKDSKESFDYNFYKYVDRLIVISDFLEDHVKNVAPNVPLIKIPPIIDFSYFDETNPKNVSAPYFLFCGSSNYDDIVKFIIEVFIKSKAKQSNYKLKLIINGSLDQLKELHKYIKDYRLENDIEILSKLPYFELISIYKSAEALLIPLTNNLQDRARFPFKICEYTASGRPIITSNSSSIHLLFEDNINAFIAESDSTDDFANKLNLVISQPSLADSIGVNGYKLGKRIFNYKTYTKSLTKLIEN